MGPISNYGNYTLQQVLDGEKIDISFDTVIDITP